MHNEFSFCMQQPSCSNWWAALHSIGVPSWRSSWSWRGGADVRLVAALIEELVVGGRGRKKKKQLCRREREEASGGGSRWAASGWASGLWWRLWRTSLWWRWLATRTTKREGEKKCAETEEGADFWPTLYPIFFFFKPWNPPLFLRGGRWIFCI